ncbi:hypothetical protein ACLIA0_10160 [Bacillaceae bacterium W0354]
MRNQFSIFYHIVSVEGKIVKYELVSTKQQVLDNVIRFNQELDYKNEQFLRFLSLYRQWYYFPELDLFGPSKFIGYKDMTAEKYINKKGKGADGRDTEKILRQLMTIEASYSERLTAQLEDMLREFNRKPFKNCKINVVR